MGKLLQILALLGLLLLSLGTSRFSQFPAFWLASGASLFQYIRELLIVILTVQIVTQPPRHMIVRVVAAFVALTIGTWAIKSTFTYGMQPLDTLGFIGATLAIGVTALERRDPSPYFTVSF